MTTITKIGAEEDYLIFIFLFCIFRYEIFHFFFPSLFSLLPHIIVVVNVILGILIVYVW